MDRPWMDGIANTVGTTHFHGRCPSEEQRPGGHLCPMHESDAGKPPWLLARRERLPDGHDHGRQERGIRDLPKSSQPATGRQTGRQTDRQTDRHRQADRQILAVSVTRNCKGRRYKYPPLYPSCSQVCKYWPSPLSASKPIAGRSARVVMPRTPRPVHWGRSATL
jgi:hypothetical protein